MQAHGPHPNKHATLSACSATATAILSLILAPRSSATEPPTTTTPGRNNDQQREVTCLHRPNDRLDLCPRTHLPYLPMLEPSSNPYPIPADQISRVKPRTQGKGSRNRTTNSRAFWANYDAIFRKPTGRKKLYKARTPQTIAPEGSAEAQPSADAH